MTSDSYTFKHKCDAMPDGVRFCKLGWSDSSQFTVEKHQSGLGLLTTVLYGFRYCPYCGKDMEGGDD